jgi:hypothetical protein
MGWKSTIGSALGGGIIPGLWEGLTGGVTSLAQGLPGLLEGNARNEFRDVGQDNFRLPGGDEMRGHRGSLADMLMGREGPQMQGSDFRADQRGLADRLRARAEDPQMARMMLEQGIGSASRNQQAQAQTAGRGGNAALAARNAASATADLQSGLAGQSAMYGLQESDMANQLLGSVLQGARGQDQQFAATQAGLDLQSRGMNDQAMLEALRQQMGIAGMQQAGGMGYEGARTSRFGALLGVPTAGQQMIQGGASLSGLLL